jgi:hypothetical protein
VIDTEKLRRALPDMSPADQAECLRRLAQEIYNDDLYLTAKDLLGYEQVNWQTHGETIETLEAPGTRKLIVLPRGSFKSSLGAVAYPIWLLNNNPNLRILLDSELYTNSVTYLREIKAHMESPKLEAIYGKYKNDKLWQEGAIQINQRTKIKKEASITAGGLGTRKIGQHFDVIIGDDYNSPQNTSTPEHCMKIIDHFRYNLNILDPGGIYVIIGTRYAEMDLIGWVLRELLDAKDLSEGKLPIIKTEAKDGKERKESKEGKA